MCLWWCRFTACFFITGRGDCSSPAGRSPGPGPGPGSMGQVPGARGRSRAARAHKCYNLPPPRLLIGCGAARDPPRRRRSKGVNGTRGGMMSPVSPPPQPARQPARPRARGAAGGRAGAGLRCSLWGPPARTSKPPRVHPVEDGLAERRALGRGPRAQLRRKRIKSTQASSTEGK